MSRSPLALVGSKRLRASESACSRPTAARKFGRAVTVSSTWLFDPLPLTCSVASGLLTSIDPIVRELRAKGVDTIDFLPRFSESGLSPEAYAYDLWHMNGKGHDLVGQAVAQLLIQSDTASPPL